MTLTNATWSNAAKQGNVRENWLFKFFYDTETANEFTGLSLADTTVSSVFYHGVITSRPRIRSRIDLAKSTASTDNLTITIADKPFKTAYAVQDTLLSGEMGLGGTRKYINRKVEVYSQLKGELTLSNCLQVGLFRLIGMSHKAGEMTLQLASHRPWDFISIPNVVTETGKYFPVVYGDFNYNATTQASQDYVTDTKCFPMPIEKVTDRFYCLLFDEAGISTPTPHYYDESIELFIPLDPVNNTQEVYEDGHAITWYNTVDGTIDLRRGFKYRKAAENENSNFNNFENAFDDTLFADSDTLFAQDTVHGGPEVDGAKLYFEPKQVTGTVSEIKFYCEYELVLSACGDSDSNAELQINDVTSGVTAIDHRGCDEGTGTTTGSYTSADRSSLITNGTLPQFKLQGTATVVAAGINSSITGTVKVNNVGFLVKVALDDTNEPQDSNKEITGLKNLYSASDGFSATWDSDPITEIHEAHRDLLQRYTSFVAGDLNSASWTAIESARDWKIRYWVLEPTELKKVLEQLQYEGGFIFKWKADGAGAYVFVADTYASADVDLTGRDIGPLTVGHTPFSELITKMEINYQKHPAEKKYISNETSTNGTARTAWNIKTAENIKEINLDANVDAPWDGVTGSTNPNDDFYSYYDNIFGDIKLAASCAIVNPAHFTIETGDTVSFSDVQPEKAFNTTWTTTDPVFMVTETQRGPGQLIITCREVT